MGELAEHVLDKRWSRIEEEFVEISLEEAE